MIIKDKMRSVKNYLLPIIFLSIVFTTNNSQAQTEQFDRFEPELAEEVLPSSAYSEGLYNGMSFNVEFNDFGIALGTQYRRGISFNNELILDVMVSALKDEREQQYQSYFGQIIPNKFNRAFIVPATIGIKRRHFATQLSDAFRVYSQVALGAVVAFTYPYFDDELDLGYICGSPSLPGCESFPFGQIPNDVFQGWGDGEFHTGVTGQIGIGIDFGSEFRRFQSVRFSYMFHYFPDGIQLMEPNSPNPNFDGFEKESFYGTPTIVLQFGRMW